MTQYVAYHFADDKEDGVPIATGEYRDEVLGLAAQRVLVMGVTWGTVSAQLRDDLSKEDFDKITKILDSYFSKFVRIA